jgi:hypothetical protein
MTTLKVLPARPSLESLRKQAKKLARDIVVGDTSAIARARTQLAQVQFRLSQRDAQLVLAREYGFAGWNDLVKEVKRRLGRGLEWAVTEVRHIIHDNDVEALRQLLAEYPALLSWKADEDDGGLLGMATRSYSDSGNAASEEHFTRLACAEFLLDAGAIVSPSVCDSIVESRAKGLLQLFERRGLLPHTLKFRVALEDLDGVRALIESDSTDFATVNEAFRCACHFEHEPIASALLDRLTAFDAELGRRIDDGPGRAAFIKELTNDKGLLAFMDVGAVGPWQTFLMRQVVRALHDNDLTAFVRQLQGEPWLLADSCVGFQVGLVERATLRDRAAFITALFDLDPALTRCRPPPRSQAIEFAFTYVKTHLLPVLICVWPLPDDLPHAAGNGDLPGVKRWFDAAGKPALGDLTKHFPWDAGNPRRDAQAKDLQAWFGRSEPNVQLILDTALAWAVLNNRFEVADFLLQHGADINTRWSSHEPASILHELVFHEDYEAMQFLIDRGIDMTIEDYRWGGTAQDWAYHAAKNERMVDFLAAAERKQKERSP